MLLLPATQKCGSQFLGERAKLVSVSRQRFRDVVRKGRGFTATLVGAVRERVIVLVLRGDQAGRGASVMEMISAECDLGDARTAKLACIGMQGCHCAADAAL